MGLKVRVLFPSPLIVDVYVQYKKPFSYYLVFYLWSLVCPPRFVVSLVKGPLPD